MQAFHLRRAWRLAAAGVGLFAAATATSLVASPDPDPLGEKTGGATTVWVDFPNQKSAPLPDWLREVVAD